MSTLSSANVTDVNLVLKERTHMRLCLNMLIFTHNLGNWLIAGVQFLPLSRGEWECLFQPHSLTFPIVHSHSHSHSQI